MIRIVLGVETLLSVFGVETVLSVSGVETLLSVSGVQTLHNVVGIVNRRNIHTLLIGYNVKHTNPQETEAQQHTKTKGVRQFLID